MNTIRVAIGNGFPVIVFWSYRGSCIRGKGRDYQKTVLKRIGFMPGHRNSAILCRSKSGYRWCGFEYVGINHRAMHRSVYSEVTCCRQVMSVGYGYCFTHSLCFDVGTLFGQGVFDRSCWVWFAGDGYFINLFDEETITNSNRNVKRLNWHNFNMAGLVPPCFFICVGLFPP